MNKEFSKINIIDGVLSLGGDKSISHRAVMFASLADGESVIYNCSHSVDVWSTVDCFRSMGCEIEGNTEILKVKGKGFQNLEAPVKPLDAGNSGTTARLISGILAAQKFQTTLIGDESLSNRPMKRIIEPLQLMGAKIESTERGTLPITIYPVDSLTPMKYEMKVASAQVKSAVILAGIHLEDESFIIEKETTRNHTEKLLNLKTETIDNGTKIYFSKKNYPLPFNITIPSDISSAAFFMVLALLADQSDLLILNVSLNETRTGIIEILKRMGGNIAVENLHKENGELCGDLRITNSKLHNVEIPVNIIPNIIDEIPILAVAGVFAEGNFKIVGARELRVKESDRIKSICENFRKTGLDVNEYDDGFELSGRVKNESFAFESYGDHRIAMAFGIFCSLHNRGGVISDFGCVGISNPNFAAQLRTITK